MKYIIYKLIRLLVKFINKFIFRVEFIDRKNIPLEGNIILAGNHTHNFDALLMIGGPNRIVHTLSKKELFNNIISNCFFRSMACIPVDRSKKDNNACNEAIEVLKNNGCIGIFPEGTTNKTIGTKDELDLLPFKYGAVSFASKTNSYIVPFAIKGKYKFFRKSVKIIYGKPYKLKSNNLEKENNLLMNKVSKLKGML